MTDYTDEEFMYITKTVMKVLDAWNLTTEQAVQVLGLPVQTKKRQLDKYRTLKALASYFFNHKKIKSYRGNI